jgi:hypothetical protein
LDKNEIAALLESLCDRPFAADPQGPPVTDAGVGESAPEPSRSEPPSETPGSAAIQADDPGRPAVELASILSGTATPAQCQAFQEAAVTSSAVRLEAQSVLAFLDGVDAVPLAAPAHLVAQTLASGGGTPSLSRPGIWSRLMHRPGRQVAAACAVMVMAGGVSWSLLRHGDLTGDGVPVPPASAPQAVGPLKVIEPAPAPVALPGPLAPMPPASPAGSEFSTQSELPARSVAPLSAPPLLAQPAAPAFAPVPAPPSLPSPQQALTDPCGPRSVVASDSRPRSKVEAKAAKPAPGQPPRVAALSEPDPGCGVGAVEADQGQVPAAKPAARIRRSDRSAPAAATSAPAYAPAAPAKHPAANAPPR